MLRSRTFLCAVLAAAALAGGAIADAGTAAASKGQTTYFEAPAELLSATTRPHAISQLKELGIHAIRLEMIWSFVAPGAEAKTRPSFEAKNPASYAWGEYEALIDEVHALGWQVLLTVSSPVPRWATSNKEEEPYATKPSDTDFEEFMVAVGKKFRSDVSTFAIWNEPNEYGELRPQFNAKGEPEAGRIYRGLFEAGYRGLQKAGLSKPTVLMGETSPGGFTHMPKEIGYAGIAPLTFLRDALCLNTQYKRQKSCKSLPASGYSQHPYALDDQGPFDKPKLAEDVTMGTIGRLVTALNKAAKAGAIKANLPIYLTEFGVMSKPNKSADTVSVETQAAYDAISERIAWESPRVAAFSQYLLEDDPISNSQTNFQTGIEYSNGGKKPLYHSFPVPLTVTTAAHGYNLWGYVRPAKKATTVTVLIERPKSNDFTVLKKVKTGSAGYWTLKSTTKGSYWKVRWTSPEGVEYEGTRIKAYPAP